MSKSKKDVVFYALRPFAWARKNIDIGQAIALNEVNGRWMQGRKAVTSVKSVADKAKKLAATAAKEVAKAADSAVKTIEATTKKEK
jgi:hypothetical protein